MQSTTPSPQLAPEVIDDLRSSDLRAATGARWELVSDQVMGGISQGRLTKETLAGRSALRLTGDVRLENNGGFVQAALDINPSGRSVDARQWTGLRLAVFGNNQVYNLHLRTSDIRRPWESYRHRFHAGPHWTTVELPFAEFTAHRTSTPLNLAGLRRIGIVAIGRAFQADVGLADIRFCARK